MTNQEYEAYLKSDKWRQIAEKRFQIDGYRCVMCGCKGTSGNCLEVHHLSYRYLGHEENRIYEDLVTLCHCCHKQIHAAMNRVTNPDGRHGWKDNRSIPGVSVYTINGQEMEHKRRDD